MSIINKEQLIKQSEKITIYKNEEEIIIDSLKEILNNYNNLYRTNNQEKLNEIKLEIFNKLNIIKNNHNNYIEVIEKTIKKYDEMSNKKIM